MNMENRELQREPFISADLRPEVVPRLRSFHPLSPTAAAGELRGRALKVLGMSEEEWFSHNSRYVSQELWKRAFHFSSDITWNRLDDETVLLNLENGRYYTLNRTGSIIWDLISEGLMLEQLVDRICDRFEVAEQVARDDLLVLVGELHRESLIKLLN
jgi:Coenzyme PQQ synthesis protein D (PqqD)